jgi:hypothetical protein
MRNLLICLNIILLCANCVREVEYAQTATNPDDLVVTGRITNLNEPHILRLSRPGDYRRQRFDPVRGAAISLSDDLGNLWVYAENQTDPIRPYYALTDFVGQPGRAYTLHIDLPNGAAYATAPQVMPQPIPMDSIGVRGEMVEFIRANGAVTSEPNAVVYAHATTPASGQGYLRWDAFMVYIFDEIVKSYNPFAVQKQCFITDYFSQQIVSTYDLSTLQPNTPISFKVGQKRIGYAFEKRQVYSMYQLTISREAYDYWQKVNRLLVQNGSIFDAPPAVVPGNVLREGGNAAPALGFFEVCSADVRRRSLFNGDLGPDYRFLGPYCNYDYSRWPPVNHIECDDCLTLPASSLEQPWYW